MKILACIILYFLLLASNFAQPSMNATRITDQIDIDGQLTEGIWEQSDVATDFITWQPTPGLKASQRTTIKVLYDDDAIYFGATMYVPSRDSIMTELTQRDDVGNTDFIGIFLDTYGNGTDAFEFIIAATGVQFDAKLSNRGEDNNWDAVWFSAGGCQWY